VAEIAIDFLAGTGFSSRLIEKYGGGPGYYSHCASRLADGRYIDARDNVIAGVPAGVRYRRPDTETWLRKQTATLQVTPQEYQSWDDNLVAKITTQYDRSAILGFLEGKSMHTAGKWICSALAINAVQHISRSWTPPHLGYIPFPLPVPAHEVSPNSLLLILATAGFTIGPVTTP
jgi:hypothetical protein